MHNVEVFVNYNPPCNSVSTARRLNKRTMNDDDEITEPVNSMDAEDSHVLSGGLPERPRLKRPLAHRASPSLPQLRVWMASKVKMNQ